MKASTIICICVVIVSARSMRSETTDNSQPTPSINRAEVTRFQQHATSYVKPGISTLLPADSVIKEGQGHFRDLGAHVAFFDPPTSSQLAAPWEMLTYALTNQFSAGHPWKGMQVVATPASADWNDPKLGNWIRLRRMSDSIPVWGPAYLTSAKQVTAGYSAFVGNIAIPISDPAQRAKAENARKKYQEALNQQQQAELDLISKWTAFDRAQSPLPPDRRKTYDEWYAEYGGPIMSGAQQKVQLAAQDYDHYIAQAFQGYGFAATLATDFDNPANQVSTLDQNNKPIMLRTFSITPDLDKFIADSKALPANAPPKMSYSFNKASGRTDISQSSWGGSASWFGVFGASASGSNFNLDTSSDSFGLEISAKNYQVFTITPGPWFNGTAIAAFKNGPWVASGPVAAGTTKLWGADGIFDLLPVQVIVAYKPKVVLKMSAANYHEAKSALSAGGGFSIGPFGFGASYSRSESHVQWDDQNSTLTAEDVSDIPQIVMVISSVLPDFN